MQRTPQHVSGRTRSSRRNNIGRRTPQSRARSADAAHVKETGGRAEIEAEEVPDQVMMGESTGASERSQPVLTNQSQLRSQDAEARMAEIIARAEKKLNWENSGNIPSSMRDFLNKAEELMEGLELDEYFMSKFVKVVFPKLLTPF